MPASRKKSPRKKSTKQAKTSVKSRGTSSARGGKKSAKGTKPAKKKSANRKTVKKRSVRAAGARGAKRTTKRGPASTRRTVPEGPQRLQKVLAAAGVASRRECEQLVLEGRVEVDREVVTKLGTRVDPEKQKIRVDGTLLKTTRRVYYAVNKPDGVVSTSRDPSGRPRVIDMLPETFGRVFTVGRLDMASEGLILLTNDGELANQLTHPRYGVSKTYEVQIAGMAEPGLARDLERGVHIADGFVKADKAKIKRRYKKSTILEIILSEGKNREIRRLLARLGHKVQRLKRVAIGPLRLGELPQGHVRPLEQVEVKRLWKAVSAASASESAAKGPRPKRASRPTAQGRSGPKRGAAKPKARPRKKVAAAAKKSKTTKPIRILTSPESA